MHEDEIEKAWEGVEQLLAYANNDDCSPMAIRALRKRWEKSKDWLAPHFGPDGRIFEPVNEPPSSDDLDAAFSAVNVHGCCNKHKHADVVSYDSGDRVYAHLRNVLYILPTEDVIHNRLSMMGLKDPSRPDKFLPPGSKVSSYLKKLITNLSMFSPDVDCWENCFIPYNFSDRAKVAELSVILYSQLLTALKSTKSTVALSINPVDFILVSAHTNGSPDPWSSCHHFANGEYRTGCLSYLCDTVSAVAFGYNQKTICHYDGFEQLLPLKSWRQMVYFGNGCAGHSREYPISRPSLAKQARRLSAAVLMSMAGPDSGSRWKMSQFESSVCKSTEEEREDEGHGGEVSDGPWHYRDEITAKIRLIGAKYGTFKPGAFDIPCLSCGHDRDRDGDADSYTDDCCSVTCYRCENSISIENIYRPNDGNALCKSCYKEYYSGCSECGEVFENDGMFRVDGGDRYCGDCINEVATCCSVCGDWTLDNSIATTEDGYKVCPGCLDDLPKCSDCGNVYRHPYHLNGEDSCDDCVRPEEEVAI